MKKILPIIVVMAILAFAGTAWACDHNNPFDPTCTDGSVNKIWTDIWDPDPNIFFGTKDGVTVNSASHTFNITDSESGLFVPDEDWVNNYIINIDFLDDKDCWDSYESATISVDGITYSTTSSWFFSSVINDKLISFYGTTNLNDDGTLSMTITRQAGDFYFNIATLTAFGCDYPPPPNQPPTSAPEPATLLLLGLGLISLAGLSRKMKR